MKKMIVNLNNKINVTTFNFNHKNNKIYISNSYISNSNSRIKFSKFKAILINHPIKKVLYIVLQLLKSMNKKISDKFN
jgi:hypothetical protein